MTNANNLGSMTRGGAEDEVVVGDEIS